MIKSNDFEFNHIFINSFPSGVSNKKYGDENKKLTFVLLHSKGGNEEDLILEKKLSVKHRYWVPEEKFWKMACRDFLEGYLRVFDLEDLRIRSHKLWDFIQKCSVHYNFDLERTIAIGFSIEANKAVRIFFLRPELFQGPILFRAMFPFIPNSLPNLLNKRILLSAGIEDPIVPKTETENL